MSIQSVSTLANMTSGQITKIQNVQTDLVLVQAGDIGVDYVTGSAGEVKTILEYQDAGKTILLSTTNLKYQDAGYPTKVTSITTT